MADEDLVASGIQRALDAPSVAHLVAAYFDRDRGFAADTFDTLQPNAPSMIAVADILALTTLDVRVPPRTLRLWLATEGASRHFEMLLGIDPEVRLWDEGKGAEHALKEAGALWTHLQRQSYGVGPVIAGKLLTRKRPHLIPVYDSVVKRWMGRPMRFWLPLRRALQREPSLVGRLEELRPPGVEVSTLRLLDVAVWMLESRGDAVRRVREQFDLP